LKKRQVFDTAKIIIKKVLKMKIMMEKAMKNNYTKAKNKGIVMRLISMDKNTVSEVNFGFKS